jgi:sugar O-acyltransferase (sialic acid O-acetyltransferase NeuD family)
MTNKDIVIFGDGSIAELAHYYFENDTDHQVAAFCVDGDYVKADSFCGKPMMSFKEAQERFPPEEHAMFIAIGYSGLNGLRRAKYDAAEKSGYELASYVSSRASVLNDGNFGKNCFILEDNTVQPFVTIGDNVTLWSGNHIGHHSTIKDNVFVSSHVVVSGHCTIEENCFLGVNATIRDGVIVGAKTVLGAGAIILGDVEAEGVYLTEKTERWKHPSSKLRGI